MTFQAILFDCDGVLVDSESITNGVLCAMLNEAGWALSAQECMALFIGKTVRSEAARIEAHTGRPLTDGWMAAFYARRNARLQAELQPIDGALDAVRAVHARLQGRIACASGADRHKVDLAAAAALGVAPARCLVVEDTVTGVTAGVAAGATVLGYSPGGAEGAGHGSPAALRAAGAADILHHMGALPAWLEARRC